MTWNAEDLRIEGRSILPVADVVELEPFARAALLATIAGADKRSLSNGGAKFAPPGHAVTEKSLISIQIYKCLFA